MSLFGGIGVVVTRYGKFLTLALYLFMVFFVGIQDSVEQKSIDPLFHHVGSRILSADHENYQMARAMEDGELSGPFSTYPKLWFLYAVVMVALNSWFMFRVFWLIGYLLRGLFSIPQEQQSFPVFIVTAIIMVQLHVNAFLYYNGQPASPIELVPFYGTFHAFNYLATLLR